MYMTVDQLVLNKLLDIPKDKVTTYGALAKAVGLKSARHIGRIMANNEQPDVFPCYKVVASDGSLTGYSGQGGLTTKRLLLENDGVCFKPNGKVDLNTSCHRF